MQFSCRVYYSMSASVIKQRMCAGQAGLSGATGMRTPLISHLDTSAARPPSYPAYLAHNVLHAFILCGFV